MHYGAWQRERPRAQSKPAVGNREAIHGEIGGTVRLAPLGGGNVLHLFLS